MTRPVGPATGLPARVPAVGGARTVPAPDPIARDYLLLALRLDGRISGLVDGYFGPADLKALVDTEQPRPVARLVDDAVALLERLPAESSDPARQAWLAAQIVAFETHARVLAGEEFPYPELVARLFDRRPAWRDEAIFEAAAAELDRLVPGAGQLPDRLATWDEGLVVAAGRVGPVVEWLVARFRERAARLFGLPKGEALRVSTVRGQPWNAYNWHDGGLSSRVDINLDLPIRAADLARTVAHETYPGHHLEHATKEATLVERGGCLEASVLLINTPECLVSEGLAEAGVRFVVPPDEEPGLLAELFERAAVPAATSGPAAREAAGLASAIGRARRRLGEVAVNAALLRHAEGAGLDAVGAYLRRHALLTAERAAKRLEFIEHPLWRTYVFVYPEGEALVERWLDAVPAPERPARFGRLLREAITPASILAEIPDGV